MNNIQLWAFDNTTEAYVKLDLYEEEAVVLSFSAQDVMNPTETKSNFSRTFRVPSSTVNGQFFKSAFNVNSQDFDATLKVDAYINDTGFQITSGNIRLISIVHNYKTNNIEYEILFLGETSDFASSIGPGFLCDLQFPELNHVNTYDAIVSSWDLNLKEGDVVYPLIEWGYLYNDVPAPTQSTISDGYTKSFTVVGNPLETSQFKPAIRIKAIWNKIFDDAGYTYESSFFDSAFFESLYYVADKIAKTGTDLDAKLTITVFYGAWIQVPGLGYRMYLATDANDTSNLWNPNGGSFDPTVSGVYTFSTNVPQTVKMVDVTTQTVIASGIGSFSATLTSGKHYTFFMDAPNNVLQIVLTSSPSNVTMSSIFSCDYKKIDFIRSIVDKFKLVLIPSKMLDKHFEVTPWVDWIKMGNIQDWTDKLDNSKDFQLTPLFYSQDRFINFSDVQDTDYLNDEYQKNYKKAYGSIIRDSNIDLIKGQKTVSSIFAPSPLAAIANTGAASAKKFLIPHIAKGLEQTGTTNTGKREPIAPKPRIMFYNGRIIAPKNWYLRNGSGVSTGQSTYPLMSNFSAWPPTTTTFDINWNNTSPLWDPNDFSPVISGLTGSSSYTTFWSDWYTMIYDPYSRLATAHFKLDYNDITNLNFNNPIWVKDAYYFINEVSNYNVGKPSLCKVEMYKYTNATISGFDTVPIDLYYIPFINAEYACCGDFNGLTLSQYYIIGTLGTTPFITFDAGATLPVPAGTYSNGIDTFVYVDEFGIVTTVDVCDFICITPGSLFPFDVCYGASSCDACDCVSGSFVSDIFGKFTGFVDNSRFWGDSSGLTYPPIGWYQQGGVFSTTAIHIGANGFVTDYANCDDC